MRRLALTLALLTAAGCDLGTGPDDVRYVNRRPMEPPDIYAEWYAATAECRGVRGDFAAVRWFVADDIRIAARHDAAVTDGREITIQAYHVAHATVIRHEADHHITREGNGLHLHDGGTLCDGTH